jgi:hypothetical protein
MKILKLAIAALVMGCATAPALASHVRFGVMIGGPFWGYPGYYYPPPYYPPAYYPPAVVAVPTAPPTYVEQAPAAQAPAASVWYYCTKPKGYYPYVQRCPGGWQQVAPTPPDVGGAPQ